MLTDTIYKAPPVQIFQCLPHDQPEVVETALATALRQRAVSQPLPIRSVDEMYLGADGRTTSGMGYSASALDSLTRRLSAGLPQLVRDLLGYYSGAAAEADPATGCLVFNAVLQARFSRLENCYMLLNLQSRCIEGIVGPQFRSFSHADFHELVTRSLADCRGAYQFQCGVAYGRHLLLSYLHERSFVVALPEYGERTFRLGVFFHNSEIDPRSCRGCLLLWQDGGLGWSLFPAKHKHRLRYQHRDFAAALSQLLKGVLALPAAANVCDQLARLGKVATTNISLETDDSHYTACRNWWNLKGQVPKVLVSELLSWAAWERGGQSPDSVPPPELLTSRSRRNRTCFDIYCCATKLALFQFAQNPLWAMRLSRAASRWLSVKFSGAGWD